MRKIEIGTIAAGEKIAMQPLVWSLRPSAAGSERPTW